MLHLRKSDARYRGYKTSTFGTDQSHASIRVETDRLDTQLRASKPDPFPTNLSSFQSVRTRRAHCNRRMDSLYTQFSTPLQAPGFDTAPRDNMWPTFPAAHCLNLEIPGGLFQHTLFRREAANFGERKRGSRKWELTISREVETGFRTGYISDPGWWRHLADTISDEPHSTAPQIYPDPHLSTAATCTSFCRWADSALFGGWGFTWR